MPSFTFTSAVGANATFLPLTGWQYEYVPWAASIRLLIQSSVADSTIQVTSGSETIQEFSPVSLQPAGSSNIPAGLNISPISWRAPAGDRLKLNVRTVTAGTVSGIIYINPLH